MGEGVGEGLKVLPLLIPLFLSDEVESVTDPLINKTLHLQDWLR